MWSMFSLFQDLAHLLFPRLCNACNRSLLKGEYVLCLTCCSDLPYTDFHLYEHNLLAKQFWGKTHLHSAMALLYFNKGGKTQKLIHNLKYKQQTDIGLFLGRKIGESLLSSVNCQNIDVIIPVPLHPGKERKRGYNQSKYLAMGIAEVIGVPVNTKALIRTRLTKTQTKKDRYTRFKDLNSTFKVTMSESLVNKHILLVDDVITTGATLEACAMELQKHAIQKLSIAAAAYVKQ